LGAIIIALALVAIILTGAAYYIIIPYYYNIKLGFEARVTDNRALEFGDTIYTIIGIFPLLFFGAIALNAWVQSSRQSNQEEIGF